MKPQAPLLTPKRHKAQNPDIDDVEFCRLHAMTAFERQARNEGYRTLAGIDEAGRGPLAGIDEAGRGPLAGPVPACACVIPEDVFFPGIDDSKKLSAKKRAALFDTITNDNRIVYTVEIVSPDGRLSQGLARVWF